MYGQFHQSDYRYSLSQPSSSSSGASPKPGATASSQNVNLIGQPIHFASGQFSDHYIRAELREIQKAELGRKYAKVDRRPLDPPPIVLLRLFKVLGPGTDAQTEKEIENYDEVQVLGLVCSLDLFPVPDESANLHTRSSSSSSHSAPYNYPPPNPYPGTPAPLSRDSSPPTPRYLALPYSASDILFYIGNYPVTESSKQTQALAGTTFVQPANVEYQGRSSLMFVFSDLAVKIEGTFILRYRFFDLFSKPHGHEDLAIQAECYGGPFRIYSSKEVPGLRKSTELTKHVARYGVKVNVRETERKRKRRE